MVEAPRSKAFTSLSVTVLPLTMLTVLKSFALFKVMLLAAPAARVVGPATVRLPLSVIAPLVVTVSPPLMVEAPRSKAFTSLSVTVLPLTMLTVLKSFALFKVMLLAAPAVRVVGPATVRLPLSVRAPLVVTVSPPLMVEAPRSKAFTSLSVTVLPLTTLTVLKSLALFKVMVLAAPAVKMVGPVTVKLPLSVIAPLVVTVKSAADGGSAEIQGIHIVERDGVAAHDTDRAEVVRVIQGDVIGGPGCEGRRAGHGEIAAVGDGPIGGDGESAADGGGAEIQGIHIVERDGIAAHDTDRVEVVGIIERDVIGRAGREGRRAGDGEIAAIGNRAIGGDGERAADRWRRRDRARSRR